MNDFKVMKCPHSVVSALFPCKCTVGGKVSKMHLPDSNMSLESRTCGNVKTAFSFSSEAGLGALAVSTGP